MIVDKNNITGSNAHISNCLLVFLLPKGKVEDFTYKSSKLKDLNLMLFDSNPHFTIPSINATLQVEIDNDTKRCHSSHKSYILTLYSTMP